MDLLIIIIIAAGVAMSVKDTEIKLHVKVEKPLKRETKLNPDFYDDPAAFRRLIDELDF